MTYQFVDRALEGTCSGDVAGGCCETVDAFRRFVFGFKGGGMQLAEAKDSPAGSGNFPQDLTTNALPRKGGNSWLQKIHQETIRKIKS